MGNDSQKTVAVDSRYEPRGIWQTNALGWRVAIRLMLAQLGIGMLVSSIWLLESAQAASAGIVGSLIAVIPTAYFAVKVFSQQPGSPPRRVLNAFYFGEMVRLILTATLFIIALQWFSGEFAPLITTFTAALFSYWLILMGALRT